MNKIVSILIFLSPSFLSIRVLKLFGANIGKNVRIGFSYITTSDITIGDNVRIGHLNLILNKKVELKKNARIGYLNVLKGPFNLLLEKSAAIGNKNYITRGRLGVTYGESTLKLGVLTKVTVGHHLDLTQSIKFGDYSILAGIKSQMWTHGYVHASKGADRFRVDGGIEIGNNVYIGSGCIFNPGVKIYNEIHLGAGSVISKDIEEKGMYVNQPLRLIKQDYDMVKEKLTKIEEDIVEAVYKKK